MSQPRVLSIQVGLPRTFGVDGATDPTDRPWTSGTVKGPVEGPVWVGRMNLDGDGQADLTNHGGPDKAVLLYAAAHYPAWRDELALPALPYGGFGENCTVAGQTEEDVCIGDTYAIGDALLQISQPRQPCWKQARRWGIKDLTARIQRTGRTGWYARVLREGAIAAGQPMLLLDRPHPEWVVARATRIMGDRRARRGVALALSACPLLSAQWRAMLALPPADGEDTAPAVDQVGRPMGRELPGDGADVSPG